ncbi:MAG TPA: alpha/beta hydrolase [Elusimicrobia bacterium]|nr:alpha/beta hydrolase [Elusimicrobiota bacterium]
MVTSPNRSFDLGGLRMHYRDEGSGDPVVMLHGNPSWSYYYRGLIDALKGSCRCIAPDHVGMGLSDKPGDDRYDYTLSRRVQDLEALLENLGVRERVTLVLHDWGGMIGMAWAARRPEKVSRLVILNTAAFLLPAGKRLPWQLKLGRDSALGALLIRGCNAFARGAADLGTVHPMAPETRAAYLAPYGSWAERIATLRFVQDIPLVPEDRAYALAKETQDRLSLFVGKPMLVCWGMKDFVFDADFLAGWETRFPKAEVHRFPDAGHYVLEDEGPAIAARVKDFLARHPA